MRNLLTSALLFAANLTLFGQGQIYLNNYVPPDLNAPVKRPDGSGAGAGITAQLMMVTGSGDLVALNPAATFRTSPATAQFYVNSVVVNVPNKAPGSTVVVRLRAFSGSDFNSAMLKGESADISLTIGGDILPPPNLVGLQGFTLTSGGAAPTISVGPQSQTVPAGSTVTLSVTAAGSAPLRYQWQKNGVDVSGATGSSLAFSGAKESDSARYRVVVRNSAGSVTSQEAVLTVLVPPHITSPVQSLSVPLGGDAAFSVQATGTSLKYQWQHNGSDIPGATTTTLKLAKVQFADAGTYRVFVANDVGKDSSSGTLSVVIPPFVQRQLPGGYAPGAKLVVTLKAQPRPETQSYLIEDQFPQDWIVGAVSNDGIYDSASKKVKFGPVFDNTARTFTYEVTPAAQSTGEVHFLGTAVADGLPSAISGDQTISPISLHPADNNPADQRLTGVEVSAYGAAWKRGDTWQSGPNPIPAAYVTRAAALWRGGEYYKIDTKVAPAPPLWWVNTTANPQSLVQSAPHKLKHDADAQEPEPFFATVPDKYVPGLPFTIQSQVVPPPGTLSYVVEEDVPAGWTVSNINESGTYDSTSHQIRWGLFFDGTIRRLSFDVAAPTNSTSAFTLTGIASFDGTDVPVSGDTQSVASCKLAHPVRNGKGGLDLDLSGSAGEDFIIEVSSDLLNWTQLRTFHNLNGLLHFEDSDTQMLRQKFFRAVAAP